MPTYRFQSTLPRGERQSLATNSYYSTYISIHAPTRGATNNAILFKSIFFLFQSTLPRGERPIYQIEYQIDLQISIHAPTRGATPKDDTDTFRQAISIHAPTRGATFLDHQLQSMYYISIHAPTRGATRPSRWKSARGRSFQSTLPRGERQYSFPVKALKRKDFNPRSHAGSDLNPSVWLI